VAIPQRVHNWYTRRRCLSPKCLSCPSISSATEKFGAAQRYRSVGDLFHAIRLHVLAQRFRSWDEFERNSPPYSIALEALDDLPGQRGSRVSFDHHTGVLRQVTMSAAMQAYLAVRQSRLMGRWLRKRRPIDVYVWNADQDVCLASFVLEYHDLLECALGAPLLRWIVQYNNKIDICGGWRTWLRTTSPGYSSRMGTRGCWERLLGMKRSSPGRSDWSATDYWLS
jgi:hypothetical protein